MSFNYDTNHNWCPCLELSESFTNENALNKQPELLNDDGRQLVHLDGYLIF